jgi:carboxymethylenebutenolidase
MKEQHLDIDTAAGSMNTFITRPDEGGPFPVVFFYMDAPGKREELHDMARRIASVGYYVVLPNLYYRKVREFSAALDDTGIARIFEMMGHLSNQMVVKDTQAMIDFVDTQCDANAARIGAVGYCMSGPFVTTALASYPQRLQCAASIYGALLVTEKDDSPHRLVKDIVGEIYFACAEIDEYASADQIHTLQEQLEAHNINHRIEWYPGAQHGFAFPLRERVYDKPSAERHWARLFDLFARNLRA